MKKYNLLKFSTIAFLSSFVVTMYSTKFKAIMLGASAPTYLIFAFTTIICGLLLLNKEDLSDWVHMVLKTEKNTHHIPDTVYNFCKKYYFSEESETIEYVKTEVKSKSLANFFTRYLDKNTMDEIDDYIASQELILNRKKDNARKVISNNNLFLLIGVIASYCYDSNIKGVLIIAGVCSIYNLYLSKNIETNIVTNQQLNVLYKTVAEDILNFRNAKYIMYKCKGILMLDDEIVTIDNIEAPKATNTEIVEEGVSLDSDITVTVPLYENISIESRKSALITLGKNKKAQEKTDKNRISI